MELDTQVPFKVMYTERTRVLDEMSRLKQYFRLPQEVFGMSYPHVGCTKQWALLSLSRCFGAVARLRWKEDLPVNVQHDILPCFREQTVRYSHIMSEDVVL